MGCWWVRSDACGLFSANLSLALVLYALFAVNHVVIIPTYGFGVHFFIFTTMAVLALWSHCKAQFTDPGALPKNYKSKAAAQKAKEMDVAGVDTGAEEMPRVCTRCRTVKPTFTHHCSTCGRCILRMDHHCPWVNNCVGVFNQKYFILFLFWTMTYCIYGECILISRFFTCTSRKRAFEPSCRLTGAGTALVVVAFVEGIVFCLFTGIMLFDQVSAILDNTPGIDAMQNKKGEKKPALELFKDVFGEDSVTPRWLIPVSVGMRVFQRFELELEKAEVRRARAMLKARQNDELAALKPKAAKSPQEKAKEAEAAALQARNRAAAQAYRDFR